MPEDADSGTHVRRKNQGGQGRKKAQGGGGSDAGAIMVWDALMVNHLSSRLLPTDPAPCGSMKVASASAESGAGMASPIVPGFT